LIHFYKRPIKIEHNIGDYYNIISGETNTKIVDGVLRRAFLVQECPSVRSAWYTNNREMLLI